MRCNNCGSKNTSLFLQDTVSPEYYERFDLIKCKHCKLISIKNFPKDKVLSKYYSSTNYWGEIPEFEKPYGYLFKIIESRIKKPGVMLDIGAGTGLFLKYFKEKRWQVSGVEFSKNAVKIAKNKFDIGLKTGDFLDFKFKNNYFDVVTLNNVLEHLRSPNKTLGVVYKVLKKSGILVVTVPNINSLGFKIFKKNWYGLDVPRHLFHFSTESLSKMIKENGFDVLKIEHAFLYHNKAVLFESFRNATSPRIKTERKTKGVASNDFGKTNFVYEIFKNLVVYFAKFVFGLIANSESLLKHGEVITLIAIKN